MTNPSVPVSQPPDLVEVMETLPVTGSQTLLLVALAFILILSGSMLVAKGGRRLS